MVLSLHYLFQLPPFRVFDPESHIHIKHSSPLLATNDACLCFMLEILGHFLVSPTRVEFVRSVSVNASNVLVTFIPPSCSTCERLMFNGLPAGYARVPR